MKFPIGSEVRVDCPGSRWHGDEGTVKSYDGQSALGPYQIDFNGAVCSWQEQFLTEATGEEREPQHISGAVNEVMPATGEGGDDMRLYQTTPTETDEATEGNETEEQEGEGTE